MTDAVVRMVRDTLARVRHLSPDAIRQESRALVDRLPFADRTVLRLWAVAILRCLPAPPDPSTVRTLAASVSRPTSRRNPPVR